MKRCSGCGFDAPADFAFCPKCGGRLPAACPACGFACPPDFAFCPKCGAKLGPAAVGPQATAAPGGPSARAPAPAPSADQRLAGMRGLMPAELAEKVRAAAEAGTAEGERRPVTVLFADLSGFTSLSETMDPEDVAVLLDRCLRTMAEAVYRYEGTVDKYIGDEVMALFGAPVAHEDDPERAIRAALEMQDRIERIDRELQGQGSRKRVPGVKGQVTLSPASGAHASAPLESEQGDGTPTPILALHIGINTGVVVAGAIGSDRRREYTVLGDAVNVASRLMDTAEAGQVIVGEHTYRLAGHAVEFEPLGALALKGKAEPLPAYRVLGLLAQPRSARGLESLALAAPLVGRHDELEQVAAAFERMLRGRTQVVSLIGEAGAGKSRLLREFFGRLEAEQRLETARVAVRRAVCSSLGEATYGVVASFFRDGYGISPDDPDEVVKQKIEVNLAALGEGEETVSRTAPLLGHILGVDYDDPRLRFVEPEQLKRQLFLAVRDLLERRLQQGPLLLVVEDLHWADAASVELLRFALDRLGDRQLMVLAAHRPTFDAGSLASSRATQTAIRLAPLNVEESNTLLDAFFGPSASCLPARLHGLIVSRAGGNPFYLEEVVRSLAEAGVLVRDTDGWTCTADVATVDVPPTVQGVLLARLDRLPPEARRLVQEAAVLGTIFSETLLRAVSSDPDALELYLDLLQDAELLDEVPAQPASGQAGAGAPGAPRPPERQYRFLHTLAQEVAYQSLLVRRRTELHGRAGMALEEQCRGEPERLEDLEALGHHFSLSNEKAKGAHYLMTAGDWARGIYANEDAGRYYERALETLRACDPDATRAERLLVCERLGDVLAPAGRRDAALKHYASVLQAAEEDGNRALQARMSRKIGGLHWGAGERGQALAAYQAGLALLDAEDIELAYLYQELGRAAFRSGDNQQAITWAQQARDLAGRLAATAEGPATQQEVAEAIAHAQNTLGVALARTGALAEAVGHIEQCVEVAQAHELPQVACRAYTNLGVLYSTLDPAKAIDTCVAGLELAKKIGDLSLQPWLYANLAGAYCTFTGQCEEEGIAAARTAIDLDRQLGQLDHLAVPLIVLGQIYQCHGEPELALQSYQEALGLAEEMGEPQLLFPCYDGLATLYLEGDDEALAESYMLKAQDLCERTGVDPDSLVVLPFLS